MAKKKTTRKKSNADLIREYLRDHPYDYEAAGIDLSGIIHPLVSAVKNDTLIGAIHRHLHADITPLTGGKGWREFDHDISTERGREQYAAIAVQGLLRLSCQAHELGRAEDERDFAYQAAVLWSIFRPGIMNEIGKSLTTPATKGLQLKKQAKSEAARMEFERRRNANPRRHDQDILNDMAGEMIDGKLRWGAIASLNRYRRDW